MSDEHVTNLMNLLKSVFTLYVSAGFIFGIQLVVVALAKVLLSLIVQSVSGYRMSDLR